MDSQHQKKICNHLVIISICTDLLKIFIQTRNNIFLHSMVMSLHERLKVVPIIKKSIFNSGYCLWQYRFWKIQHRQKKSSLFQYRYVPFSDHICSIHQFLVIVQELRNFLLSMEQTFFSKCFVNNLLSSSISLNVNVIGDVVVNWDSCFKIKIKMFFLSLIDFL